MKKSTLLFIALLCAVGFIAVPSMIHLLNSNKTNAPKEDRSEYVQVPDQEEPEESPFRSEPTTNAKKTAQQKLDAILEIANSGKMMPANLLNEKRKEAKALKNDFPNLDFSALEGTYQGNKSYKELDNRLVNWKIFCSSRYQYQNNPKGNEDCEIIRVKRGGRFSKAQNKTIYNWIKDNLQYEIELAGGSLSNYYNYNCN